MSKGSLFYLLCFVLVTACSSNSSNSNPAPSEGSVSVVAVGGNFSNPLGLIYLIKNDATLTTNAAKDDSDTRITTYQDSIVKSYNDKFYVFGKDSNSAVLVLDNSGTDKDPIANYSLSKLDPDGNIDLDDIDSDVINGTNPYDIAFKSESEAYVAFYNSNYLLKINPLTGKRLAKIDASFMKTIAGATPSDAKVPNIVSVKLVGNKLYILAQRLSAFFVPLEPVIAIYNISTSAFIDTNLATEAIDGIVLSGKNPSDMIYASNTLYIAQGGSITYPEDYSFIESTTVGSTGIEKVNLTNNTTSGIVIPGTSFGGTTGGFGISKILYDANKNKFFAVYTAFDFKANIKEFNITTNTVDTAPLLFENAFAFGDTTIDFNGYIYQINRSSSAPSIDVYNPVTKLLIKSIATDLPLSSIATVQ